MQLCIRSKWGQLRSHRVTNGQKACKRLNFYSLVRITQLLRRLTFDVIDDVIFYYVIAEVGKLICKFDTYYFWCFIMKFLFYNCSNCFFEPSGRKVFVLEVILARGRSILRKINSPKILIMTVKTPKILILKNSRRKIFEKNLEKNFEKFSKNFSSRHFRGRHK